MTIIEAVTLSIAVLGAVLGLINTWLGLDKSRVKLRVRPMHAIPVGSADPRLTVCIEVTNLSVFAVTIDDVGFLLSGTKSRAAYTQPVLIDGGRWPRRLEPRSSVTVYGQPPEPSSGARIKCAYARTECGVTQTGVTPAMKQIAANVR